MTITRIFRSHGIALAGTAAVWLAAPSIVASQQDPVAPVQVDEVQLGEEQVDEEQLDEEQLDEIAQLVDFYERVEAGEADAEDAPSRDVARGAGMVLDHYVREHPDDVRALILFVRLARVLELEEPVVISQGRAPDPPGDSHPSIAALNHALSLEPDNAQAHYWLARIYGITVPKFVDDTYRPGPVDLEKAIEHASRAAELDPAERRYREAAAIYLALALRFADAIEMLRDVDNGKHLVRRILMDLESVPLPPEARYLPIESAATAETMAERGRFARFATLRVRNYVAPGSASVFTAQLRRQWPELELYEQSRETWGDDSTVVITSMQFLDLRAERPRPTAVREIARLARDNRELADGILVMALEFVEPSEAVRAEFQIAEADRFTLLSLANVRLTEHESVAITPFGERLLGQWDIERWSYRSDGGMESYTGMLGVTAQLSAIEFAGELITRSADGNWGRQRMRITLDGDGLELSGRVIASYQGWLADTLSLRLDGSRLTGTSIDSGGEGGDVVFVKR